MILDSPLRAHAPHRDVAELRLAIASDAAPERNGVGAYYQDLIGYLAPRVSRVELYSPTIEDGIWQAGVVLPMPGDATQRLCVPNIYRLRSDLADLDPHVMIVPTPGVYGVMGAFLAARRGVPVITGFHTSFEQLAELYWHGSITGRVFLQYIDKIHKYLIRASSAVIVNSSAMEAEARAIGAQNIVRIGTPLSRLFATSPVTPYEGSFKKILFAGRLAAEKKISLIIDAARQMPGLTFSIAGDGPLREEVERAAEELENVCYLGWLNRERLLAQVDANDCVVLPSYFESFGTIALEAMSRKRVVIVSKTTGIADWPHLSSGLEIMGEGGLTPSLTKLAALSSAERQARAERAFDAAHTFNEENLRCWESLLINVSSH